MLEERLKKAEDLLTRMADNPPTVEIIKTALPEPLNRALKDLAAQYPDLMSYDEEKGAVRWKADLLFPLGSDQLANSGQVQDALQKFAEIVNSTAAEGFDVIVVGHTCTTPIMKPETLAEHKTNWHLSAHRAIAVMKMLAGQNVPEKRMGVMGYGEHRPISGDKAKNRRVEIFLVPSGSVQNTSSGG
jgi:chemotaxis protein MotB